MTFAEKLAKLTEDKRKNVVAERAKIAPRAISDYLSKGTQPGAETALRLARVLRVDVDWLIDEEQDWPPVRVARRVIVEEYAGHAA
ncbi:MAG TPA: helix-turn-helix transcriptional regulator [Humisphaera sp.]|nr:helix-turn-helix transcriptional regulator [Humisphaera sp.]